MARFAKHGEVFARQLLDKAAADSTPGTDGSLGISGIEFHIAETLIGGTLERHPKLATDEHETIAHQALFDTLIAPPATPERFLANVKKREAATLQRSASDFILVADISVARGDVLRRQRIDGVTISFPASLPAPLEKARQSFLDHPQIQGSYDRPSGYRYARLHCRAKTPSQAGDVALDALLLLQGLWNLYTNRRMVMRMTMGAASREPINTFAIGPIVTMHELTGRSLDNYVEVGEPIRPPKVAKPRDDWTDIDHVVKWSRLQLQKTPYAAELAQWIRSYTLALSLRDKSQAFVRLWQVLESATSCNGADYERTQRRVSFMFADAAEQLVVLRHLRGCRNELVHTAEQRHNSEGMLYVLKRFVEETLRFHLVQGPRFSSLEEVLEFLDLPTSATELRRRSDLLSRALKYRPG